MLAAVQDDEQQQLYAANLISFYYLRHKKCLEPKILMDRKTKKIFLYQILYYPLVKRILSYLLTFTIHKRYSRVRIGTILLQKLWLRRDNDRKPPLMVLCDSDEEFMSDIPEDDFNNFLCQSPAVIFRGNLLTTPRLKGRTNSPKASSLRVAPSIATPIRTNRSTKSLIQSRLTNLIETTPTRSKIDPLQKCNNDKRRPQRVIRKPTPASTSTSTSTTTTIANPIPRQVSEEAELAKVTQQNTLNNSGYLKCEIVITDVIREHDRPESPSNRFSKTSTSKRKWSDTGKAKDLTQEAWKKTIISEKSPKGRHIKWDPQLHFIEEEPFDDNLDMTILQPIPFKKALRIESSIPKSTSPIRKSTITVQRILYLSELQPKQKKTLSKRVNTTTTNTGKHYK